MTEGMESVKEIQAFILESKRKFPSLKIGEFDLVISDVPRETLRWFRKFANSDEFSCGKNSRGHYGFAFKFLCDFFTGRIVDGSAIAEAKADEALSQIAESKMQAAEPECITLVNGKRIIKR